MLWGHKAVHVQELCRQRQNRKYLPGIPLKENIHPTASLAGSGSRGDRGVYGCPLTQPAGGVFADGSLARRGHHVVSAIKGIENTSLKDHDPGHGRNSQGE